jgi:hypothetical protein
LAEWEGVGVEASLTGSGAGKVRKLVLCSNKLCGSLPDCIGQLVFLEELWLDDNLIDGQIPWRMGALTNLTILGLSANKLSGALPDALMNLHRLEVLEVQYNGLYGDMPSCVLESLHWLIKLDVSSNPLQGALPTALGSSIFLEHVAVYNTGIGGVIPHCLQNCQHLTHLIVYESLFSGAIPAFFRTMPFLRELELSRCFFDEPSFGKRDFDGQFRGFPVKFFFHGQSSPTLELVRQETELKDEWRQQMVLAYNQNKANPYEYPPQLKTGSQLCAWTESRVFEQFHGHT